MILRGLTGNLDCLITKRLYATNNSEHHNHRVSKGRTGQMLYTVYWSLLTNVQCLILLLILA